MTDKRTMTEKEMLERVLREMNDYANNSLRKMWEEEAAPGERQLSLAIMDDRIWNVVAISPDKDETKIGDIKITWVESYEKYDDDDVGTPVAD